MAHPQSSPRGLLAKQRVDVGAQQLTDGTTYLNLNNGVRISGLAGGLLTATATELVLPGGVKVSNAVGGLLTANATDLLCPGGVRISGARILRANSTGFVAATVETALPETDNGAAFTVISNSTGVALAINTTGTTWKYLSVTSIHGT